MIEAAIVLMVVFTFSIISHCSTVKREPPSAPCEIIIIVPPDEDNESVNESEDSGSDTSSDTNSDIDEKTLDEKIPSYFDIVK